MDLIRFEPAFRGLEKLSDQLNRFLSISGLYAPHDAAHMIFHRKLR